MSAHAGSSTDPNSRNLLKESNRKVLEKYRVKLNSPNSGEFCTYVNAFTSWLATDDSAFYPQNLPFVLELCLIAYGNILKTVFQTMDYNTFPSLVNEPHGSNSMVQAYKTFAISVLQRQALFVQNQRNQPALEYVRKTMKDTQELANLALQPYTAPRLINFQQTPQHTDLGIPISVQSRYTAPPKRPMTSSSSPSSQSMSPPLGSSVIPGQPNSNVPVISSLNVDPQSTPANNVLVPKKKKKKKKKVDISGLIGLDFKPSKRRNSTPMDTTTTNSVTSSSPTVMNPHFVIKQEGPPLPVLAKSITEQTIGPTQSEDSDIKSLKESMPIISTSETNPFPEHDDLEHHGSLSSTRPLAKSQDREVIDLTLSENESQASLEITSDIQKKYPTIAFEPQQPNSDDEEVEEAEIDQTDQLIDDGDIEISQAPEKDEEKDDGYAADSLSHPGPSPEDVVMNNVVTEVKDAVPIPEGEADNSDSDEFARSLLIASRMVRADDNEISKSSIKPELRVLDTEVQDSSLPCRNIQLYDEEMPSPQGTSSAQNYLEHDSESATVAMEVDPLESNSIPNKAATFPSYETKIKVYSLNNPPAVTFPTYDGFGKEMKVLWRIPKFSTGSAVKIMINITPKQLARMERWTHRDQSEVVERSLCFSLACYPKSTHDFSDTSPKYFNTLKSTWPYHGSVSANILYKGQPNDIPLSPPLTTSPDGLFDLTQFLTQGNNEIIIKQDRPELDALFVVHAHYPTRAQLQELSCSRKEVEHWHRWLDTLEFEMPPGRFSSNL